MKNASESIEKFVVTLVCQNFVWVMNFKFVWKNHIETQLNQPIYYFLKRVQMEWVLLKVNSNDAKVNTRNSFWINLHKIARHHTASRYVHKPKSSGESQRKKKKGRYLVLGVMIKTSWPILRQETSIASGSSTNRIKTNEKKTRKKHTKSICKQSMEAALVDTMFAHVSWRLTTIEVDRGASCSVNGFQWDYHEGHHKSWAEETPAVCTRTYITYTGKFFANINKTSPSENLDADTLSSDST